MKVYYKCYVISIPGSNYIIINMNLLRKFRKKTKILPPIVVEARTAFDNCSIYKEYMTDDLLPYLNNLLIRDVEWLRMIINLTPEVEVKLNNTFSNLTKNLIRWKNLKKGIIENTEDIVSIPKYKKDCISDLIANTYDCYIALISIFVSKSSSQNLEDLEKFGIQAYENISKWFNSIILTSKLECLKKDLLLGFSDDLPWNRINSYLKEHFYLFIFPELSNSPGFFHSLLQEELKFNKVISNTLTISEFEDFFRSFFSSFESFEMLVEKNIFYHYINSELEKQYIFINQLHKNTTKGQPAEFKLQIFHSKSAKYKDRVYELNNKGLVRVTKNTQEIKFDRRSEPDYLVFFGSDKNHKFHSDITLNLVDNPDPSALIFINRCGLNIIDISPHCSVKLRIEQRKLEKKDFIILGRSVFLHIQVCDNLSIKKKNDAHEKLLIFYVFEYGEYSEATNVIVQTLIRGDDITLGKSLKSKILLDYPDIRDLHAVVKVGENGEVLIEDRSGGNLFISLKNKTRLNKGKWSHFTSLRDYPEFFIDNVGFKIIK